jgi:MATE family multidrug resistance protein
LSFSHSGTRTRLREVPVIWRDLAFVTRLAIPVALGELGWMFMSVVDTIMVAPLGPVAIGAIGIGNSAYYTFAIFGMGLLLGLDTLVSHAFGANNRHECHRWLLQGLYGAVFITVPLMVLFAFTPEVLATLGVNPEVSHAAGVFVRTLSLGTLPLLLYGAFRRYLQAMGHVRPIMFALLSANLVNWFFNWLLILGHWRFPALGVVGSAISTCFARLYLAAVLAFFIWWFERNRTPGLRGLYAPPDWARLSKLLRIGFPAATQILLEIGAFGTAAVMAGRLNPVALASHQIALNCAAVTFMVPLGISSAAAVSVGQAIGAGDIARARRRGFLAVALACVFMTGAVFAFILIPRPILKIYTSDPRLLRIGTGLLAIAAAFQLFDGIQTVSTGALRGLANTRTAMLVNFLGYWFFGLPVGYVLCFDFGFGVYGIWWGLTLALIAIACTLLYSWNRHSRRLALSTGCAPA